MRVPKTASAYWSLLTSEAYNLRPDIQNFNSQLRLLQKNRASGQAARLLKEDLVAAGVEPMVITFRIAMGVCARDWKNQHALEHATDILSAMETTISDPDVETLKKYLSLAVTTNSGPKVVAALDRLDSIVYNLRSRILYGPADGRLTPQKELQAKTEAQAFFRQLVGAIDTLMDRGLVPREDYSHWHARRSQLSKFVGRSTQSTERSEERLLEGGKLGDGKGGLQRVGRARVMFESGRELKGFREKSSSGSRRARAVGVRAAGAGSEKWVEGRRKEGRTIGEAGDRRKGSRQESEMEGFADSPADFGMY
ncbi:hypothetical protein B0A55_12775 [Friedmanniomyces simplex]|uniref:Uncharacterized protein n=1 Tax=Friedmanniomyces simplex TaxID=329884 RepID=A0A4U0VQY1_9PEZI|nr:hypothetical protein B0A55_12775 [Friedmanniomyces simplex]